MIERSNYRARAWRIVDRVLPALPSAHGFYQRHEFIDSARRLGERNRLYWRTFARLRAKAEGGKPYLTIPPGNEHLFGPGDAMFDVARELERGGPEPWRMADELPPPMVEALKAWPDTTGIRKDTIRSLRIRGLLLPRGRSVLGDETLAYLDRKASQ